MALSFHDFADPPVSVSHLPHTQTDPHLPSEEVHRTLSYAMWPDKISAGSLVFCQVRLITLIQQRGPSPHPRAPDGSLSKASGSVPVPRVLWVLQTGGASPSRAGADTQGETAERDGHLGCGPQGGFIPGVSHRAPSVYIPSHRAGGSLFSTPSPALTVCRCFSMTAILTCVRCYRRRQRRPGTWEGARGGISPHPGVRLTAGLPGAAEKREAGQRIRRREQLSALLLTIGVHP